MAELTQNTTKRKSYCHHCNMMFEPPANVISHVCRRCEREGHSYWIEDCNLCGKKPILPEAA